MFLLNILRLLSFLLKFYKLFALFKSNIYIPPTAMQQNPYENPLDLIWRKQCRILQGHFIIHPLPPMGVPALRVKNKPPPSHAHEGVPPPLAKIRPA